LAFLIISISIKIIDKLMLVHSIVFTTLCIVYYNKRGKNFIYKIIKKGVINGLVSKFKTFCYKL